MRMKQTYRETMASLLPLVVPILLILGKTTCDMLCPEGSLLLTVTSFIGDSNIALAIGAVLAIATLGKRLGGKKVLEIMDKTLKDAGPIVFHYCRRAVHWDRC